MTYDVVTLRFDVEKIRLGRTEENVVRHTNANTYLNLSVLALGTATTSLRHAIATVHSFTLHGHACMNRSMCRGLKS